MTSRACPPAGDGAEEGGGASRGICTTPSASADDHQMEMCVAIPASNRIRQQGSSRKRDRLPKHAAERALLSHSSTPCLHSVLPYPSRLLAALQRSGIRTPRSPRHEDRCHRTSMSASTARESRQPTSPAQRRQLHGVLDLREGTFSPIEDDGRGLDAATSGGEKRVAARSHRMARAASGACRSPSAATSPKADTPVVRVPIPLAEVPRSRNASQDHVCPDCGFSGGRTTPSSAGLSKVLEERPEGDGRRSGRGLEAWPAGAHKPDVAIVEWHAAVDGIERRADHRSPPPRACWCWHARRPEYVIQILRPPIGYLLKSAESP